MATMKFEPQLWTARRYHPRYWEWLRYSRLVQASFVEGTYTNERQVPVMIWMTKQRSVALPKT